MNRHIENNLEAYLSGSLDAAGQAEFRRAVDSAGADAAELVAGMEKQSLLIRSTLRPEEMLDPAAGFYARVMDRIEAQRSASPFWSALLEPLFFKRLVVASSTLLLLLGFTLFTGGPDDLIAAGDAPHVLMASDPEPMITVTTVSEGAPEGRDMLLGDLTTYQE